MYISLALDLIANAKQRQRLVEYSRDLPFLLKVYLASNILIKRTGIFLENGITELSTLLDKQMLTQIDSRYYTLSGVTFTILLGVSSAWKEA